MAKKTKQVSLYEKTMILRLAGSSKDELRTVAHNIHKTSAEHPLVLGGEKVHKVSISSSSLPTVKVFSGVA
jgi:hypothetical protein